MAARFVRRPNRFIVEAALGDGALVQAHLADPGRLRELLVPGAALRLRPAAPAAGRRTAFTVVLVRATAAPRPWVSVLTTRANTLARGLLERGTIRGLGSGWSVRPEVRHGKSRFDFLLSRKGEERLVEVKSVSLVHPGGVGLFPDAPTTRGARHLAELSAHVRGGGLALVLFVAQRADARSVQPHAALDPGFAAALADARAAGVMVRAVGFALSGQGHARYRGPLPVLEG